MKTGLRLTAVDEDHNAVVVDRFGNSTVLAADTIMIAAGFVAQNELAQRLEDETSMTVFNVGDSKRVRQIYDAVHEGFFAARQI